jgi:nanoRNase/pAp phosphatase (c-di-AMP/oligoRNAs hydrolase)
VETIVGNSNQIVHRLLESRATKYPVLVTLYRRTNQVFASFRSRGGEALKIAEKFQGGGHANASGAILPKSIRNIDDGINFLRQMLQPKADAPLNSLEGLFTGFDSKKP